MSRSRWVWQPAQLTAWRSWISLSPKATWTPTHTCGPSAATCWPNSAGPRRPGSSSNAPHSSPATPPSRPCSAPAREDDFRSSPARDVIGAAVLRSAAAAGTDLELGGQSDVGGGSVGVGQALLEQGDGGGADGLHGLAHSGQRRLDVAAEVDAIEAGDGDIAGDVHAARPQAGHDADRHLV